MKKQEGSAIIIAIIVITFISTVVIGSSQIFLSENSQNVKYLNGMQAWYAAYSGLDLLKTSKDNKFNGTIEINSTKAGKLTAAINASQNSGDIGQSMTLSAGEQAKYTINQLGQARFWLKGVDVSGVDCPNGDDLYVYLNYSTDGGESKTLNSIDQIRGSWPDTFQNNTINLYSIDKTLTLTPIFSDKFLIGGKINGNILDKCAVTTKWKVSARSGALTEQQGNSKSTSVFSGITKTLYR